MELLQPVTSKLNNNIIMPLIGLGVYDMYHHEAEQAVESALEIGYKLIDTACMYQNEKEIGNAIKRSSIKREDIFITTKLNNTYHGYDQALKAFDVSLQKLQLDYIDLYLIHWPIKSGRRESWRALEKLYIDKRVRAIGVANYTVPFLQELKTYASFIPAVNQIEFTPWLFQKDVLDYCNNEGIQMQSYSPLTRGIKFNDPRLIQLSKKYEKTPAQIILNWNIQLGVSTIPKSVKRERLQENFDALNFKLTLEDIHSMNTLNENFRICEDPMQYL